MGLIPGYHCTKFLYTVSFCFRLMVVLRRGLVSAGQKLMSAGIWSSLNPFISKSPLIGLSVFTKENRHEDNTFCNFSLVVKWYENIFWRRDFHNQLSGQSIQRSAGVYPGSVVQLRKADLDDIYPYQSLVQEMFSKLVFVYDFYTSGSE